MKVGILSMQRVINYGSFLQAYALKQLLLADGADSVEFIDIKPGRSLPGYESSGIKYKLKRLTAMCKVILHGKAFAKKRTMRHMGQIASSIRNSWPMLGLSDKGNNGNRKYDLAVIGSDEVFHCCQSTSWGYTRQLYGDIPEAHNVISYGGSFGNTTLDKIRHFGIDKEIGETLATMNSISVRDENSKRIVETVTGIIPELHIDPVLAYGYKKELATLSLPDEKGYIVVYSYPDRIRDRKEIAMIRDYARRHGKKLVCIMSHYEWCDRAVICSPMEVLQWFKYADEVITETFHGAIFSIITHRPFAQIVRGSARAKISTLLSPLGLSDRIVDSDYDIEKILSRPIDYDYVESKLDKERIHTNQYLSNAINTARQ